MQKDGRAAPQQQANQPQQKARWLVERLPRFERGAGQSRWEQGGRKRCRGPDEGWRWRFGRWEGRKEDGMGTTRVAMQVDLEGDAGERS